MAIASSVSSMARRLEGKVALITGGASGIGECTAKLFVRHGARVVVADIQDEKGRVLCAGLGGSAAYVHCDVTEEPEVARAVDTVVSLHGKLDIMFNNAGVMDAPGGGFLATTKADFERVMATNAMGAFLGTKHAARAMVPPVGGGGSIVSTASVASAVGGMASAAYTCSKHAVVGAMRSAAAELGRHGVRVNCVSPYAVATPLSMKAAPGMSAEEMEEMVESYGNLKGRRLKAEDVAEAVLYLASDESKYVSGLNLMVDGALTVTKGAL